MLLSFVEGGIAERITESRAVIGPIRPCGTPAFGRARKRRSKKAPCWADAFFICALGESREMVEWLTLLQWLGLLNRNFPLLKCLALLSKTTLIVFKNKYTKGGRKVRSLPIGVNSSH